MHKLSTGRRAPALGLLVALLLVLSGYMAPAVAADLPEDVPVPGSAIETEASVDVDTAAEAETWAEVDATEPEPEPQVGELADPFPAPQVPKISSINGRFLLLNMHGALFHSDIKDLEEDVAYAAWLKAGAIRVFATDNNTLKGWSGRQVGNRIADVAPVLRANGVKLIVALVNNHRPVPGEPADSFGFMDGFHQLLLPFYTTNYPKAYLPFVRELIGTVKERGALDAIFAWEFGNELHATMGPEAIIPFMTSVAAEIRKLDPDTPILPGTMGVEHLNPGNPRSPLGPWLYCDAPVDAYTLHSYDWLGPERQGDTTISNDFDLVLSRPCGNGRKLPVIVEELGTSRFIPDLYSAAEEDKRVDQEVRQIRYVLSHSGIPVIGIGPWNGESPKVEDRLYYDNRRGLTAYGPANDGGGSCYAGENGARCRFEQILRNLPSLP